MVISTTVRPCEAKNPATCRFHGSLIRMEQALKNGDLSAYAEAKKDFTQAEQEKSLKGSGDVESALTSRWYAHYSIFNKHMHNSNQTGSAAELIYYSSPQGKLELERRKKSAHNNTYANIEDQINSFEEKPVIELDEQQIASLASKGKEELDEVAKMKISDALSKENVYTPNVRHYLAEQSHKWLKTLSTEQQEAVSWLTSNGGSLILYAIGEGKPGSEYLVFKNIVDEDAIYDKHFNYEVAEAEIKATKDKIAADYLKKATDAFKNAPKFDKPLLVGRGTSLNEVKDLLGKASHGKTLTTMMNEIEKGNLNGVSVNSESRMRKIPLSASASLPRAGGFGNVLWDEDDRGEERDVVVVIKAKSATSPINVSAWGSSEYEVLTNPHSDYKITGGHRLNDDKFIMYLEEV